MRGGGDTPLGVFNYDIHDHDVHVLALPWRSGSASHVDARYPGCYSYQEKEDDDQEDDDEAEEKEEKEEAVRSTLQ